MWRSKAPTGETHFLTTEAAGTFDAVSQAVEAWCRFWWSKPDEVAIVRCGDRRVAQVSLLRPGFHFRQMRLTMITI
jgi:hypothetical protein